MRVRLVEHTRVALPRVVMPPPGIFAEQRREVVMAAHDNIRQMKAEEHGDWCGVIDTWLIGEGYTVEAQITILPPPGWLPEVVFRG